MEKISKLKSANGVLIFSKSTCCLCYAVQMLFQELRVHPTVYELDSELDGKEVERALRKLGCSSPVPTVFIGGQLIGSTNEVMSHHLGGRLVPLLRPYQNLPLT